jgi:hypothetical protein
LNSWPTVQLVALEDHARKVALNALLIEKMEAAMCQKAVDNKGIDLTNMESLFTALGAGVQSGVDLLKAEKAQAVESGKPAYSLTPGDSNNVFEELARLLEANKSIKEEATRVQQEAFPSEEKPSAIDPE